MKKWKHGLRLLLIIILSDILATQYLSAQNIEVGAEFSYGKTLSASNFDLKRLFSDDAINNLNFGFSVSSNPHKSVLFLNSGLLYNRISDHDYSLNFFKIPAGLDFAFGRRLKFLFGGGTYFNLLIKNNPSNAYFLSIGLYTDLGFRYLIVSDWCIYLKTRMEFDQTPVFKSDNTSYEYFYNYGFIFGFKYLIPLKD
jgi:hypothetical protein